MKPAGILPLLFFTSLSLADTPPPKIIATNVTLTARQDFPSGYAFGEVSGPATRLYFQTGEDNQGIWNMALQTPKHG